MPRYFRIISALPHSSKFYQVMVIHPNVDVNGTSNPFQQNLSLVTYKWNKQAVLDVGDCIDNNPHI